jgi:thiol-disulfide isomerase/thioredoxin
MKMKLLTAGALALLGATVLAAQDTRAAKAPTLKVGDRAPKLQTGQWVQGEPVKTLEKGKAYLIEFWATWCGPCRVSIPHLNEIHTKYKDKGLIVIGQNCWERNESQVKPFIQKMGDKMTYRVALDDRRDSETGKMAETWMAAAGQDGIPTAFLVDKKGLIAWIGHPMELKETVIEAVLDGSFDVEKAAADYEQRRKNEAALSTIWRALGQAVAEKDWDKVEAKLAEAEKLVPEEDRDRFELIRFTLALRKGDHPAAYKLARHISDTHKTDVQLQNQLAWIILTDKNIKDKDRDLALAQTIAERANEASKGKDPSVLDSLARAYFMAGKKDKAVELQTQAVKLAEGEMKEALQSILDSYKKGELPDVD